MRTRRRGTKIATAAVAVLAVALGAPAGAAAAGPIGGLVDRVTSTVDGIAGDSGGGSGSSAPGTRAGNPPGYVPPAHGSTPHGQGTVVVGDVAPEAVAPIPYDPGGGSEDVVVGRARGEETGNGRYHGHITIAALLGQEILGVDTNEGETAHGPLQPIQELLDGLCSASSGQLCVTVLKADSHTTGHGSRNSFEVAGAHLGDERGLDASVASSNGRISESGACQSSHGDSNVARVGLGGRPVLDVLQASSGSRACRGNAPAQWNDSTVLAVGGNGVPLPTSGCADGTPNSEFTALSPIAATVCNASDANDAQTGAPYGTREALTAFVLESGNSSLVTATAANGESSAVAPKGSPSGCQNPPCGNGGGDDGDDGPGNGGSGGDSPGATGHVQGAQGAGSVASGDGSQGSTNHGPSASGPGKGDLPFTGADLVRLLLVGLAVMAMGLMAMALADRRRLSA
jgi:hypothetical protein